MNNNNTNTSGVLLEPTNPPGENAHGSSGGGGMTAVVTESESSSSSTDWRRIVLVILWLIALIMLFMIIFSCVRRKFRQAAAGATTATGAHKNNDEEHQTAEAKTSDTIGEHQQRQPTGILPFFAIMIALSLSVAAQTSCEYITSWDLPLVRNNDNQVVTLSSFGLWSAAIYNGSYGSDDICQSTFRNGFPVDGKLVFGRVVAILASVLGSISLLLTVYYIIVFASSRLKSTLGYHRISWLLFLATLAQALVLVILSTDLCQLENDVCELGIGATSSITATVYWFIAALSIACM